MSQIEVRDLSYQVDGQTLLHRVSASFQSGLVHAIVGQNGAGKSTLLRCLSKEWLPSSGEIQFQGRALTDYSYAQLALKRAVLAQHNDLAFSFEVQQLVSLGFEAQQLPYSEAQLQQVLQATDILHLRRRDVLTLSGGEQKRVHLARVLAQLWPAELAQDTQPFAGKWLFLDEWSEGLDLKHQIQIGRLLRQWATQGLGVVVITHDLNQVMHFSDRCLLLKQGQLYQQGPTQEVMSEANLSEVLDIEIKVVTLEGEQLPMVVAL